MRRSVAVLVSLVLGCHARPAAQAQQRPQPAANSVAGDSLLRRFDADGDGKISDAERQAVREKMRQTRQFARHDTQVSPPPTSGVTVPTPASAPAKAVGLPPQLPPSPAGGDAPVTREQFKERLAGGALATRPEVADRLFDRLDENGDGLLSAEESAKLRTRRGGGAPSGTKTETPSKPTASQADAIRRLRSRTANMPVPDNLTRRTLTVGGREREFFIHIPATCNGKPSPVVFALHGGASSTGIAMHLKADFTKLGEQHGYVTVYPSGVNGWNIGSHDAYSVRRRTSDADDIGFFRAMFDTLIAEGIADPNRMYVTGGSNGGVMTQFLACHLADRIAGAGVVVATLPRAAERDWPKPSRPVPILIMLGTEDPMKPWDGNADQMSAEETVAFWRRQNGCLGEPRKRDLPNRDPNNGCRVRAQRWEGQAPVVFYTMEGHGHGWPMQRGRDETGTGPKTRDIAAPEEFWEFFQTP